MNRATALRILGVLGAVSGVYTLVLALPMVAQGAAALPTDGPPFGVLVGAVVFAILRLVAAYPTWRGQRWGIIVTLVTLLLDGLSAAPGLLFAPTTELWLSALFAVVLAVVSVVLSLWRDPKVARAA